VHRWLASLVVALVLAPSDPILADQSDPRLNDLFARLLATQDPSESRSIEQSIWEIWLTTDDEVLDGHMQRGVRAMNEGNAKNALRELDALVAAAPQFAEGWNKRATLYWMIGDFEASVRDIDQTLALEPRHFGALSGLALIREAQGRAFEALEALSRVLEVHPHLPHLQQRIDRLSDGLGEAI